MIEYDCQQEERAVNLSEVERKECVKSGLFGGGFMRKVDCIGPEGCVQFEKVQRRNNIIYFLRGIIVWGYKLRLWGETWVQIPTPPHTGYGTLDKFPGLSKPLVSHL